MQSVYMSRFSQKTRDRTTVTLSQFVHSKMSKYWNSQIPILFKVLTKTKSGHTMLHIYNIMSKSAVFRDW